MASLKNLTVLKSRANIVARPMISPKISIDKKEYLHKLRGGDLRRQKEVSNETFPEVSTCSTAMQIPYSLVPEIPVSNSERRAWAIVKGHPQTIMQVEKNDEIVVEGSDVSEEKLEEVICNQLGLPAPEPAKKGILGRFLK